MRVDLIERFLSYALQPFISAIKALWHHPVDSVVDTAVACGNFAQENPLTTIAIVGLGAYAVHKGALGYRDKRVFVDATIDTRLGGGDIKSSLWIGNRGKR